MPYNQQVLPPQPLGKRGPNITKQKRADACVPEPPSSASPWAQLQARQATRERPTSARPILPAHCSVTWKLSRPVASLHAHLAAVQRQGLTLPHTAYSRKGVNEEVLDADLREASQTLLHLPKVSSSASLEGSSLYDLSQQWLHTVESDARRAEPGGPKNITRFLLSQKRREAEKQRAEMLDLTIDTEEPMSPVRSPIRHTEPVPLAQPLPRWHKFTEALEFVSRLSSDQQESTF